MAYAGSTSFQNEVSDQAREDAALRRVEAIARLFDSVFTVPGTKIRLGADALLNLVPGAGTLLATGVSGYLVWEARRLGAPTGLVARMIGNVAVDTVISAIPVAGWVGDVFYRANLRNASLLRDHLQEAQRRRVRDGAIHANWSRVR
jgi:hypothetical protein